MKTMDNTESFRNELVSKLLESLPREHVMTVLHVFDAIIPNYDISEKKVSMIVCDGLPEVVKYFIASKAVRNLSRGTLNIYKLRLSDFFTVVAKPFQDITANDIRMYLFYNREKRNSSSSYLDNIRRILSSFFSWLTANEYILRNPCINIESIKYQEPTRSPLTAYELEVLRDHCEAVREKALVDLLSSSGIRLSECMDLNLSDIDWEQRSIIVRHGKGDKRRIVFFDAESELTLRKYIASRDDDCEALFVSERKPHNRIKQKALENIISKIANRANMHVYPHKLRHTFATTCIRHGMPLEDLQTLMGHSNPKTTMIYAKLDNTDLQMAHRRVYA